MYKQLAILCVVGFVCISANAQTTIITFDDLQHGQVVDDEYIVSHGLTIIGDNIGGGPDIIAGFDTNRTGTADPDLEHGSGWSYGNLDPTTDLGKLIIIQENSIDINNDGILDSPDDEGSRPAGSIFLEFDKPIESFGMDIVDVEGPEEYWVYTGTGGRRGYYGRYSRTLVTNNAGYYATFFSDGAEIGSIGFGDWLSMPVPTGWDPVEYGNHSANRFHALPVSFFGPGYSSFDKVEINLGGSAGIDNITYYRTPPSDPPVPEPATMGLLVLGLGGLVARRRFRG